MARLNNDLTNEFILIPAKCIHEVEWMEIFWIYYNLQSYNRNNYMTDQLEVLWKIKQINPSLKIKILIRGNSMQRFSEKGTLRIIEEYNNIFKPFQKYQVRFYLDIVSSYQSLTINNWFDLIKNFEKLCICNIIIQTDKLTKDIPISDLKAKKKSLVNLESIRFWKGDNIACFTPFEIVKYISIYPSISWLTDSSEE